MEHVLPSELDTNFHFHWITLIIHVKNTKQDLVETTLLKLKDLRIIGLTGFGINGLNWVDGFHGLQCLN